MRKPATWIALTAVCALSWGARPWAAQATTSHKDDEAAVRAVVEQYGETWTRMDAQAFGALFTPDADVIVSTGVVHKGLPAILSMNSEAWSGPYKGARFQSQVESVRVIDPGVALVDATAALTNVPGGGRRDMRVTFVLTPSAAGWRIAAARFMVPARAGATPPR